MWFDAQRRKYVVRWREDGRRRVARFGALEQAEAFERRRRQPRSPELAALAARLARLEAQLGVADEQHGAGRGDGVFQYETKAGSRFGFKFRHSDGTSSTRRGYTSRRAARKAKTALEESIRRGELPVARDGSRRSGRVGSPSAGRT